VSGAARPLRPDSKPIPVPDDTSAAYWEAAARHELVLARCAHCGRFSMPPGIVCPGCSSTDPRFTFEPARGTGTVRSWTVIRDSFLPGFADDVPYVLVDVELDDQADLRMIGRLLDGPDAPLRLGARVRVVFEDRAPGVAIPAFALDGGA
jgi:uncharacterized OB-fold protein